MPKKSTPYDVITVGAATLDTFLLAKDFSSYTEGHEEYLIVPASTKIDIPDIATETGGGATNTAATFCRAGLRTACMAKVGLDGPGREVERYLEKEKITSLLVIDRSHQTGVSVVLKGKNGEDTILTHRGAGYEYRKSDFSLVGQQSKWLYITSLAGDLGLLARLLKWANEQGVRVAVNPGSLEIAKRTRLVRLLKQADVVVLNSDEMKSLLNVPDVPTGLEEARRALWHTVVVTDSKDGSWVLDGSYLYHAGISKKVKVIDRTGAGDAYGAGLIASIIRGQSMQEAMSFAAANATSVISYIGAKVGILRSVDVDIMNIDISVFEPTKKGRFYATPH